MSPLTCPSLTLPSACLLFFACARVHAVDYSGTWVGSYGDSFTATFTANSKTCTWNHSGNISLTISAPGSGVSGSFKMDGIQCISSLNCAVLDTPSASGTVSGNISGTTINLTLNGTLSGGACGGQAITYTVSGTISEDSIFGSIDIVLASNTTGFSGISDSLTLTRQISKALGCHCSSADPGIADPIRLGLGNLYETVVDYTSTSANPLVFERFYNSLGSQSSTPAMLGNHWRSNFDRRLRLSATSIIAERPDGQQLAFALNNGVWVGSSDVDLKLVPAGSGWILTNEDDVVESFDSTGLLTAMTQANGYAQTLQYGAGDQILSVTDSFGRALQFTYQSNLLQTVSTPDGLVLTYSYDSSGSSPGVLDRLTSVSYSTSPQTIQTYLYENGQFPFALTGIIDENTNRFATWTYDSSGRATSSQHAGGADLTQISYNDGDGSRTVTNALGSVTVYKFTTLQGMPKVTEIDRLATASVPAARIIQSYDTNGYVSTNSDWNTNTASFVNDTRGQPLIVREAVGKPQARSSTNTYHPTFHVPSQIVAPRKTTTITYDTNANPVTLTDTDTRVGTVPYSTTGQTRSWTNTYDSLGHLLTSRGPRTDLSATNIYTYDSDNLSTFTDALGHVTRLTNYNASGQPLTMIDPNGVVTRFTYDIRNRLLTRAVEAVSGNATNAFTYEPAGEIRRITLPDGSFLDYQYDPAHRLQSVSNAIGESISYVRDPLGNITNQVIHAASFNIVKSQRRVFDQLGRMLQDIGAASQTNTLSYDANGNRLLLKDPLNHSISQTFDALNRLITSVDALNKSTAFGFDAQDNLVSITDPRSLLTTNIYDGFGRLIQETSPDRGVTVYTLDKAGNRIMEKDARAVITMRTFDKLNRVLTETYPASPGENISCSYDDTSGSNFGIGRLTGFTDETGSTTLIYNERGDLAATTRTIAGIPYTTAYAYDLADRVNSITYPSGHIIAFSRDSLGRIGSVTYRPSLAGTVSTLASNITYLPFGPVSGLTYGNGVVRTHAFDQDYRLTGIAATGANAGIQSLQYNYDAANNITAIGDLLAGERSQTFSYDANDRLSQAIGLYGNTQYTYDADGNRLTRTAGNVTETYTYSTTNNLLRTLVKPGMTRSFSYTTNGNLSADNRGTPTNLVFSYNRRNRYNSLTRAGTNIATYKYNAFGERLIKTVGATTIHFHYDGNGHLIAESQSSGNLIREYVWLDDMPLVQIEASGAIYYIHPDHLNTPQKITDATQSIVWDNEQQPFGESISPVFTSPGLNTNHQFRLTLNGSPSDTYVLQATTNLTNPTWVSVATNTTTFTFTDTASSQARFYRALYLPNANPSITNNLRFPGQYFDAESSLNYNFMRDYDSTLGRYLQSDPLGLAAGLNPLAYAGSSPLRFGDRLGLIYYDSFPPNTQAGKNVGSLPYANDADSVGRFVWGGHGITPYGADVGAQAIESGKTGGEIRPIDMADKISADIKNGREIHEVRLYSCSTGKGPYSFAQQLANILHERGMDMTVWAPNDTLWAYPGEVGKGNYMVAPAMSVNDPASYYDGGYVYGPNRPLPNKTKAHDLTPFHWQPTLTAQ